MSTPPHGVRQLNTLNDLRTTDADGMTVDELDLTNANGFTAYVTNDAGNITDTVYVTMIDGVLSVGIYGFGDDSELRVYHVDRNRVRTDLLV